MTRWMTLVEAITHIKAVEKCDSLTAQIELKSAIGNGVLPVKWANATSARDTPDINKLRRSQLVVSEPGLAPFGETLRPLLLLRAAVQTTWSRTIKDAA